MADIILSRESAAAISSDCAANAAATALLQNLSTLSTIPASSLSVLVAMRMAGGGVKEIDLISATTCELRSLAATLGEIAEDCTKIDAALAEWIRRDE